MVTGMRKEQWAQTSALLATIHNLVRDTKKHPRPFVPEQFNPTFTGRIKRNVQPGGMEALKVMFSEKAA